jgi:hypothetical protein
MRNKLPSELCKLIREFDPKDRNYNGPTAASMRDVFDTADIIVACFRQMGTQTREMMRNMRIETPRGDYIVVVDLEIIIPDASHIQ